MDCFLIMMATSNLPSTPIFQSLHQWLGCRLRAWEGGCGVVDASSGSSFMLAKAKNIAFDQSSLTSVQNGAEKLAAIVGVAFSSRGEIIRFGCIVPPLYRFPLKEGYKNVLGLVEELEKKTRPAKCLGMWGNESQSHCLSFSW